MLLKLRLALILTFLLPLAAGAQRMPEERGYDHRGGDYDSFDVRGVSACQSACRRDDRCAAYTFNRRTDRCYLKDRIGDYQRNAETVTGVKEE
ncbi:MAG TPA: PAN/Apple domain-containing protein [Thermoanaerobaculia bacterium]|nr:PAN/Apple domain-containing protein [Thermoanaerobaculia bacterium]